MTLTEIDIKYLLANTREEENVPDDLEECRKIMESFSPHFRVRDLREEE